MTICFIRLVVRYSLPGQGELILCTSWLIVFLFSGYLTSGDEHLPGNYGFQDQIQALLWLSENIDNFRGDPSRITLFGSSAGSSSVGLMLLTPSVSGEEKNNNTYEIVFKTSTGVKLLLKLKKTMCGYTLPRKYAMLF